MKSALDHLIARYESLDSHVASDGYNDRDADQIIAAARAEREELVEALRELFTAIENHDCGICPASRQVCDRAEALLAKHA